MQILFENRFEEKVNGNIGTVWWAWSWKIVLKKPSMEIFVATHQMWRGYLWEIDLTIRTIRTLIVAHAAIVFIVFIRCDGAGG